MLLTTVLGSSWDMYAIAFPIVYSLVKNFGIDSTTAIALFVGAIAGAGIAGEKNCAFTFERRHYGRHSAGCRQKAASFLQYDRFDHRICTVSHCGNHMFWINKKRKSS